MDGYIALVDLSKSGQSLCSPSATIFSSRNRLAQPKMAWYDYAQMALHVDDSFTLLGSTIRRLFKTFGLGRYKSHATCLASSPWHPVVLAGTASGEVVATNPLSRAADGKAVMWMQGWFGHGWRRPKATDEQTNGIAEERAQTQGTAGAEAKAYNGGVGNKDARGLSRILEGFKAECIKVLTDERNIYNSKDGSVFATIYEERSAITALAWNPNKNVGGWAAAGMGDGLVRVENIAI